MIDLEKTPKTCPRCSAAVPADAPAGLCPKCLLADALATSGPTAPKADDDASAQTPLPPLPRIEDLARLFPQLEIGELIGRGGMGAVYRARQVKLDRPVALKILIPSVAAEGGPGFADRFAREARALARLAHPNIVTLHDFGEAGGLYFLIMEYVDGADLRTAIRSGALPPGRALAVVPQICDALQYAHDNGVVHRDIKPSNVLLDRSGRVKLADFGLAKLVARGPGDLTLTGSRHVMGTPQYMAPEQMERPADVDHRADIYSLGVTLYEMLTGELPVGRFEPPSRKAAVDARLDEVVARSLEKEPAKRYQRAAEVKDEVEAIRDGVTAPPPKAHSHAPASAPVPVAGESGWEFDQAGLGGLTLLGLSVVAFVLAKLLDITMLMVVGFAALGWWMTGGRIDVVKKRGQPSDDETPPPPLPAETLRLWRIFKKCADDTPDAVALADIDSADLKVARSRCEVPPTETVLLLMDLSNEGDARHAVLFTDEGLRFRDVQENLGHIPYAEFPSRKFVDGGGCVHLGKDLTIHQHDGDAIPSSAIAEVLNRVRELRAETGVSSRVAAADAARQ